MLKHPVRKKAIHYMEPGKRFFICDVVIHPVAAGWWVVLYVSNDLIANDRVMLIGPFATEEEAQNYDFVNFTMPSTTSTSG